jgi:hypothetical protein
VITATTTITASVAPTSSVTSCSHEPRRTGQVASAAEELQAARARVADAWQRFETASNTVEATESHYQSIVDSDIFEMELANGR